MAFSTIDRAWIRQRLKEFIDQCEVAVTDDLVASLVATKLQPLVDKLQELEAKVSPPRSSWEGITPIRRVVRWEPASDTDLVAPEGSNMTRSGRSNPYEAPAGRDLDAWVHVSFMRETSDPASCPRYSTEMREARAVLRRLRATYSRPVVCGRTTLADRSWFVRAMTDRHRGTEVLAETLPLAICRLAVIRGAKRGPALQGPVRDSSAGDSSVKPLLEG